MDDKQLPPLPPSDSGSMQKNTYDSFYGTSSRAFWGKSEVYSNEVKPFEKCEHYFIQTADGVGCSKCHAGWIGQLQAKEGKLIINGETVVVS